MNNKETEFYTVIRNGEEVKVPASEFLSTGGLTLPTQSYDTYAEHQLEEERLTADWDAHQGQPTVNSTPDPYLSNNQYDPMEELVQEGGVLENALPTLPTLHNSRRLN